MLTTQYADLFVNCCEGSHLNTGNKNPNVDDEQSSFNQQPTSSLLVFHSVKNTQYLPQMNDWNGFATVDYDTHINAKIEFSINHVITL